MTAEIPAAIVLSGGRATRLGGVSKAALDAGSGPLLDVVLDALQDAGIGADRIVVVGDGPTQPHAELTVIRENPPFSGPLAALAAGLAALPPDTPEVLALACDLPRAAALVPRLLAAQLGGAFGVVMIDDAENRQWLAARYRRAPLALAIERIRAERGTLAGASLHSALSSLALTELADEGAAADIDTPADLARERGTIKP